MVYSKFAGSWDHEDEFRILTLPPGAQVFDPCCLKAIYFGCEYNDGCFTNIIKEFIPDVDVIQLQRGVNQYELTERFRRKAKELQT